MYKINEIFISLQGEGFFTGTPSIFIRFSGCNLQCPFCDTAHQAGTFMNLEEIITKVSKSSINHIVLTGGEPSLFADKPLIDALHGLGKYIAIETNGTNNLPENIDWITLSPKIDILPEHKLVTTKVHEVKVVYQGQDLSLYNKIEAQYHFLQPCDYSNAEKNKINMEQTINKCISTPPWRLSLQTHKLIGIQ